MAVSIEEAKADYLAAKQAIGNKELKIIYVRKCKLEGKNDKSEPKIIAITTYRVFVINKKSQPKVDFSIHLLDFLSLDSSKPLALTAVANIGEKQFQYTFTFPCQDDVDRSISYIKALLRKNLLNANIDKQLSIKVESEEKQQLIRNQTELIEKSFSSSEGEPCGGLAQAYLFLCDYYGQPPIAEIVWDINKIYGCHSSTEFKLEDFDHLEQKELIPLVASLAFNSWCKKFIVKHTKLINELVDRIVKVVKRSSSIEEIIIVDCHINKEQAHKISQAITANPHNVLKRIDISKNNIEEKGIAGIAAAIGNLSYGIESLNVANCGISSKGAGLLINSFKSNKHIAMTLSNLNLSGNVLKTEATQTLCEFLAQPNALESLNLSSTEAALDLVFGALMRGCQQNLKDIDLSGNPFSYKKSKETQSLPTVQQFFGSCAALKTVLLNNTKLPSEAVKAIMVGLMNNPLITDVELDLSHNELKSAACQEISSVIGQIMCIRKLNLSNNALDQDLVSLCEAVQDNTSIKELDFSSTITKSKHIGAVSEALADMAISETPPLEKLSIADNKLRLGASPLFDCLGTNESITSIDISGNIIGDTGARLLAKALQLNTKLREIHIDRNNISYKGLQDLAYAMGRNFTLHSLPLPLQDFSAAIKHNPELYMKYYRQIEKKLLKNQSSVDNSPEQAYKIHQGFLLSSSDSYTQSTDSLVVQLQDLVSKNKSNTSERIQQQIKQAKSLIWETDTFRQVLVKLFADPLTAQKSLREKVNVVADDVTNSVEDVIKENVDNMLSSAKKICPNVFADEEKLSAVKEELAKKGLVDKGAIHNVITQLGQGDIMYKLCKSNLVTASDVAEYLKNLLVDVLQHAIKTLNDTVNSPRTPTTEYAPEIKEPEATTEKDGGDKPSETVTESLEAASEDKPPLTPLTPMISVEETTDLLGEIMNGTEKFDMPWDIAAGNRLSMQPIDQGGDDDEFSLAALKARDRLSTSQGREFDRKKKKKASLKRRPTFYRAEEKSNETEVDINLDMADTGRTSSNAASVSIAPPEPATETPTTPTQENKPQLDEPDGVQPKPREHLPSVGAFDALTTSAVPLRVNKDRAKPMAGRRAPSRVSNLAHMNPESTEKFINEQAKPTPVPSPKPSPKQRPLSEMPAKTLTPEPEKTPRRSTSEKLKNALSPRPATDPKPAKPAPSDSKKEKKGKSPIGGIKLPSLPLLKRNRASSKDVKKEPEEEVTPTVEDQVDSKPEETNTAKVVEDVKPPTTQSETVEEEKEKEEPTVTPSEPPATEEVEQPPEASPKPEAPKRPMIPKAGIPMMGGAALMAEMKKRQNKDKGEPPAPAARPKPPPPSSKPDGRTASVSGRAGSVSGPKPPPPKRPPSLKKPAISSEEKEENSEETTEKTEDKPKPIARPRLQTAEKLKTEKAPEDVEAPKEEKQEEKPEESEAADGSPEESNDTEDTKI